MIGPGLGRDETVLSTVAQIIAKARTHQLPLVIDGDGLWLITQDPNIIKGYQRAILTPNAIEYSRLCSKLLGTEVKPNSETEAEAIQRTFQLSQSLGSVTILRKGEFDVVSNGVDAVVCNTLGGLRRCSGQGDILAGTIGVFSAWAYAKSPTTADETPGAVAAAFAGACLTRACSRTAFLKHHRSVTTTRLIEHISETFDEIFELDSVKREYADPQTS